MERIPRSAGDFLLALKYTRLWRGFFWRLAEPPTKVVRLHSGRSGRGSLHRVGMGPDAGSRVEPMVGQCAVEPFSGTRCSVVV